MKIAVKDACVLIDLANGGLLDLWFQLGIETITTDAIIQQVQEGSQWQIIGPFVEAKLLKVVLLSGPDQVELFNTLGNMAIGYEDQTVLFVALREKAVLLTGDRKLRLEGIALTLDVRGVLWVMDELVNKKLLAPALAVARLQAIRAHGSRLPEAECEARLKKWG